MGHLPRSLHQLGPLIHTRPLNSQKYTSLPVITSYVGYVNSSSSSTVAKVQICIIARRAVGDVLLAECIERKVINR